MSSSTLSLVLLLLSTTACGTVGKGPDPDPVIDMSRSVDMAAPPLCSPKNCAGCCQGDICQPGVKAEACGGAGAVCAQCTDAEMCGGNLQCGFDPNAMWLVVAAQATIATTNAMGMPWRMDGTMPQPLVQYGTVNRTNAYAIVVSGSPPVWTVSWGEGFQYAAKDLLSTGLDLQVLDKVNVTMTQPLSTKHHVTLSQQDFVTKKLTYQGWEGVQTLSMILQRR